VNTSTLVSSPVLRQLLPVLGWVALLGLAVGGALGIDDNYWLQVLISAEIMIVAAVGLYVTFGLSGQVSLGQAGFYAIGGYVSGLLVSNLQIDFGLALAAGVISAAAVGLALGFPALRLRGHFLALATLGFGQIVALILMNWTWLTGGANGVRNIIGPFFGIELRTIPEWGVFVGIVAVLSIFIVTRIRNSSFGRSMQALRDSEIAASVMGIPVARMKVLAFVIGAAFAGLAGGLNAGFITYVSPGTYDLALSVSILAMVVVGGAASPWGAVIGAIILTFLPEVLRPVQEYYLLIYGVLLLLMVDFAPGGILGFLRSGARLVARPFTRKKEVRA
jgi:branched-chain amino acid transport system permease protein